MSEIRSAYDQWSAQYDHDHNRTRDLDHEVTAAILAGRYFETALEAGCGTGKNTGLYASLSSRLLALDFSPGMLARAREKVLPPRVVFAQADLTQAWPVPDAHFGLIGINLVLEHIGDVRLIFREAARALAAGGWLFVSELHPERQAEGSQAQYAHGDQVVTVPAFLHSEESFRAAAAEAGLDVLSVREWWHEADHNRPPRLLTLLLQK